MEVDQDSIREARFLGAAEWVASQIDRFPRVDLQAELLGCDLRRQSDRLSPSDPELSCGVWLGTTNPVWAPASRLEKPGVWKNEIEGVFKDEGDGAGHSEGDDGVHGEGLGLQEFVAFAKAFQLEHGDQIGVSGNEVSDMGYANDIKPYTDDKSELSNGKSVCLALWAERFETLLYETKY